MLITFVWRSDNLQILKTFLEIKQFDQHRGAFSLLTVIILSIHGILVGHSFVRRIRNHCAVYRDIGFQRGRNPRDARELANFFGRYNCINYAYTLSDSCNIYQDLPQKFTTQCDILVHNMGSNDLACLSRIDRRAVHRLVHMYFERALRTGARSIVIIGVKKNWQIKMYFRCIQY